MLLRSRLRRRLRDENGDRQRGAALVEFVLIAPVLVLIMAAIFEFGLAFRDSMTLSNALRSGARVVRSDTSSTPTKSPAPRTSPMASCFAASPAMPSSSTLPTLAACGTSRSRSMVSSTARAAAHETVLPAKVLK